MIAEHLDLIDGRCQKEGVMVGVCASAFAGLFFLRVLPATVPVARNPQVLPYQQPIFVTGVVELRALGHGASPDANHVHVHLCMHAHFGIVAIGRQAEQGIVGDPVASLDEDLLPVHEKYPSPALFIKVGSGFSDAHVYHLTVGYLPILCEN